MTITLPEGFADLQPYANKWAKATEYERAAERRSATPEELNCFYNAALKRLPEILERIDHHPLGDVGGEDKHLFHLALSLAEIAPHVELYKSNPQVPYAFNEERLRGFHCGVPD